LDQTILSLLFLGLEDGTGTFLRMMIDPPSHESIESALACLEKIGAIIRTDSAATLTPLGNHLAGIPAPPAVGKLLVMGCLLGCRNISLAIAAGLSVGRSPFIQLATPAFQKGRQQNGRGGEAAEKEATNNGQVLEARAALFKTVGNSEHALLGKAYLLWEDAKGVDKRKCCGKIDGMLLIVLESLFIVSSNLCLS
jgi:HrpA-like RNA helicase